MKKISTQCMNVFDSKEKGKEEAKNVCPRKKTLDFISQFARTYHVEPVIRQELSGFLMN